MNGAIQQVFSQVKTLWSGLSRAQRALMLAAVGALFLFLLITAGQMSRTDFLPLFTRLRPEDAGEIIAALKEKGITYRLVDDGTTVLVPKEHVYETRIELAGKGLPKGGVVGFEVFNQTALGQTDFERKLRYNWALQGELTRTIRELDGVADARVHIVLPEKSLFVEDQREATASVLLEFEPGAVLSQSQILGIANLLARSVEGLQPQNVTIVDNKGNVLSDGVAREEGTRADQERVASRLQVERGYERELERSLQVMLEKVYGPSKVVVRVSAELNFDVREETSEIFEPVGQGGGIVRSEQQTSESYRGGGTPPTGVPGVTSNVPGYVAQSDGSGEYERSESTTNYEINRRQEHKVAAPGTLDRLSVAVWIDGSLNDADRQSVEQMVTAALGLNAQRGDQVSVVAMPFGTKEVEAATAPATAASHAISWVQWAPVAGGLVAIGLFLLWRRRRDSPAQGQAAPSGFEAVVDEKVEEPQPSPISPEERERRRRLGELERMAKQQPREFARLLKTWLVEE